MPLLPLISAAFTTLFGFFTPLIVFAISVTTIVAFLLGALADPQGLLNQVVCGAIDFISHLFPQTPNNLKIGYLLDQVGTSLPLVGKGIVREIFTTISALFTIRVVITVYKLLPFKFS